MTYLEPVLYASKNKLLRYHTHAQKGELNLMRTRDGSVRQRLRA
jgi:hypothetical protein